MTSPNPFDEYEAELLEKSRKAAQEEQQAWDALSPAEKEAQRLKDEAKHEAFCKALEAQEANSNDDDDEDEENVE